MKIKMKKENCKCLIISTSIFFLLFRLKKENNNKDSDMIREYTIYDTADMYMKVAFPIHEKGDMYMKTPNRIHVRHHIYSSTGLLGIIF